MDSAEARIRVSVFLAMAAYVEGFGIEFPPLLDDVGLSRDLLDDHIGMVPLAPAIALFERAADVLNDPCYGLHLAGHVRPGGTGVLGKLTVSAPTVRDALGVLASYGHVHTTRIKSGFQESNGVGSLHWALPLEVTAPRLQYSSFLAALIVRRLREAIGGNWHPLKCEFAHREFDCPKDAAALFGDRLEFDTLENVIAVDSGSLDRPMPYANQENFIVYGDLVRRWSDELDSEKTPNVIVEIREYILQVLSSGKVDLNTVAQSIGVTSRVLQRRLEQAGTTFETVLMDTRSGLAEQLLKDTDRSVTDIAFDLGYSDPSVFTRAARRWFDMSPKDFRQLHRTGGGGV